jgi:hypothetical protein
MRRSEVWNTLHLAVRRYVDELTDKGSPIDPGKISRSVIAAHEHLPEADHYNDLLERDIVAYVQSRGDS